MKPRDVGIGRLFESVRAAVVVAEADTGQIVLWNPAATQIFGYSPTQALKLRVDDPLPDRLKGQHRASLDRYQATGPTSTPARCWTCPLHKTGEEIRIEMSLAPVSATDDAAVGGRLAIAIFRDTTERKRIEERLRESKGRFRALIQSALDIIVVTGADGTIRYMSPSVERTLGYRPEEMLGTNAGGYVHPDDLEKGFRELAETLAKPGIHPVAVETRVRHKDGTWR